LTSYDVPEEGVLHVTRRSRKQNERTLINTCKTKTEMGDLTKMILPTAIQRDFCEKSKYSDS
jgi:hypothetical protein